MKQVFAVLFMAMLLAGCAGLSTGENRVGAGPVVSQAAQIRVVSEVQSPKPASGWSRVYDYLFNIHPRFHNIQFHADDYDAGTDRAAYGHDTYVVGHRDGKSYHFEGHSRSEGSRDGYQPFYRAQPTETNIVIIPRGK